MTEERVELQGEFTAKAHATWHMPEDKKEEEEKEKEEEKAK